MIFFCRMTNPRGLNGSGESKRFFVGNLFPDVGGDDLAKLFGRFGSVASEIKKKTDIDGKVMSTFAFVTVTGDAEASDVIREYNGLKWKKHSIRVQVAQESFMQRLARERQEKLKNFSTDNDPSYDPMAMMKGRCGGEDAGKEKPEAEEAAREAESEVAPKLPRKPKNEDEVQLTKRRKVDTREKFAYETKWKFDKRKDTNYELPTTSEPTGTARGGVVNFDDDDGDVPSEGGGQSRQAYHSSSEEEGTQTSKVPLVPRAKPKPIASKRFNELRPQTTSTSKPISASKPVSSSNKLQRRRYYSSSDSEPEHDEKEVEGRRPPNVMSKLESFDSSFWRDPGDTGNVEDERRETSRRRDRKIDRDEVDDNKKRIDAMRKRQKELKGSGGKLKVDGREGSVANKKIRFEDGDDAKTPTKAAKNDLFADSDDDEEGDKADTFKIRPQFEGKRGQRLLELQSRFGGGDDRFKIDDRFGDDASGGDDESGDPDDEMDCDGEGELDLDAEKKRNLKILESMMGRAEMSGGESKRKPQPSSYFKDASKLRFDPSKEDEMRLRKDEDEEDSARYALKRYE